MTQHDLNDANDLDDAPAESSALDLRRPGVPVDLNELAAYKGEALDIIDARATILKTVRRAAISATSPEDWLLFKSPPEHGGQETAFLQDVGCQRVRDLYGIEIFKPSRPERVGTNDPAVFHYLMHGSGRCKLTGQVVEDVEGGRSSTEDFCRGKVGVELELAVRKAARANLNGSITRELAGLKSVPVDELRDVWAGTRKKIEACRLGRGYGTRDARLGGVTAVDANVDAPVCRLCKTAMSLKKGSRGNFYSCPNWKSHGKDAYTVDFNDWIAEVQKRPPAPASAAPPADKGTPPPVDEVFRGEKSAPAASTRRPRDREPGEDG
jgi:hypothetical protein